MKKGSVLSYLHHDHLGSLVSATDASGTEQCSVRFWPFGAIRSSTGTLVTDRLFTGQTRDLANDAYYFYKARYYDATIGKFHSADTVVPGKGSPRGLNRYAYGFNNPLRYSDPNGHDPMDPGWRDRWSSTHSGRTPTEQDWSDYQFSLTHAGSGQGGSWTSQNWQLFSGIERVAGVEFARAVWSTVVEEISLLYSELAKPANALAGLIMRGPDYYVATFNVSLPNPWTATLLGVTIQLILDRNYHVYFSWGATVGKSLTEASGSITAGWVLQSPGPQEGPLQDFINSASYNGAYGVALGLGVTWGNPGQYNWNDFALEYGWFSPQVGVAAT